MAETRDSCNVKLKLDNASFYQKTDSNTKRAVAGALFNPPVSASHS
uniref:Uncharacterized protein n=1 Tax=uncultured gamma proteobacterium HF0200_40H22 TaxID=710985 RepID=E0XUX4_9GAMM|nr:hypothetical protein [uncultured gamma proteobacterium HF0200_40H22]